MTRSVSTWCKHWCKLSGSLGLGSTVVPRFWIIFMTRQRQRRQSFERSSYIQQLGVGVDIGRQARIRMAHCRLRRPKSHPPPPLLKWVPKVVLSEWMSTVRPRPSFFGMPASLRSRSNARNRLLGT